jgi:DNA repair exonuclease SbcCD ATPase subunit
VKQELYQEASTVAKKCKILADGKAMKKEEFTTQIVGTLGAFATANQYFVESLKEQLKQKNHLISTLEAKLATAEENVGDQVNTGLEQAKATDQKEIEQLRSVLEKIHQSAQTNQAQVSQQKELIRQLQVKLNSVESQVIDIRIFQSQAIEIQKRVSVAQHDLHAKVEAIQNHFHTIDQALKNISLREREVGVARVTFQEAVIATMKKEMVSTSRLSILEKTRGNILFKVWERNISENRERAK